MAEPKRGRQTPTRRVVQDYDKSDYEKAVVAYELTGRRAQEWQSLLLEDMLARCDGGLWTHTKFGYSVPRRNGKNEVVAIRELYALLSGERVLHTAHRTTTSHSASVRLAQFLSDMGYEEVQRVKKGEAYDKHYTYSKQFGLERVVLLSKGGGSVDFRTRSGKGGLGEGFDLLVIDEAQEYTEEQESALKYVVTDSQNPQTLFCGTPPTPVSSGTVFLKYRRGCLAGEVPNGAWAEWSVDAMSDPKDRRLWYETNPSLGGTLSERAVADELGGDETDFNIQRLGLWISYSLKSAISGALWESLRVDALPRIGGRLFVGVKYGIDSRHVCMSVAVRCDDGRIFVECAGCRPKRDGDSWLLAFIARADIDTIVVDGKGGREVLEQEIRAAHVRGMKTVLPDVSEVIGAHTIFETAISMGSVCHTGQPSLTASATSCEKRPIGSRGGWGYQSLREDVDVALLESAILAHWACYSHREKKKQVVSY